MMCYSVFNNFLVLLNANCSPPNFQIDQVDRYFFLSLLLLIQGDAIILSPQLVRHALWISLAPGHGSSPSNRYIDLSLHRLPGEYVCYASSLIFCHCVHWHYIFLEHMLLGPVALVQTYYNSYR